MRNREEKGDLSVQAIAGTHVVQFGMDLPEQNARACSGLPCGRQMIPRKRNIVCSDIRSSPAWNRLQRQGFFVRPKDGTASDATFLAAPMRLVETKAEAVHRTLN
jgi:hypothetical protein